MSNETLYLQAFGYWLPATMFVVCIVGAYVSARHGWRQR